MNPYIPDPGGYTPAPGKLPKHNSLAYAKLALELLLLLLAVPWLLRELTHNPSALSRKAANHHLKG